MLLFSCFLFLGSGFEAPHLLIKTHTCKGAPPLPHDSRHATFARTAAASDHALYVAAISFFPRLLPGISSPLPSASAASRVCCRALCLACSLSGVLAVALRCGVLSLLLFGYARFFRCLIPTDTRFLRPCDVTLCRGHDFHRTRLPSPCVIAVVACCFCAFAAVLPLARRCCAPMQCACLGLGDCRNSCRMTAAAP